MGILTYTLLLATTQIDALLSNLGILAVRKHLEVMGKAASIDDLSEPRHVP